MRLFPALILATSVAVDANADPDCRNWKGSRFWEQATVGELRTLPSEGPAFEFATRVAEADRTPERFADAFRSSETARKPGDGDIGIRIGNASDPTPARIAMFSGYGKKTSAPTGAEAYFGSSGEVDALQMLIPAKLEVVEAPPASVEIEREIEAFHDDLSPLHYAAWAGSAEAVRALVKAGASLEIRDEHGFTPMHMAAYRSAEAVRALADAGADLEARAEDGETPMHLAALTGTAGTILALAEAGADLEARTDYGTTPMHAAANSGSVETVQALLDAGADAAARAPGGYFPADLAEDNEEVLGDPVYQILLEARSEATNVPNFLWPVIRFFHEIRQFRNHEPDEEEAEEIPDSEQTSPKKKDRPQRYRVFGTL